MYFFIAGITTKILLWVFVAMFCHIGFVGVMSTIGGIKFELPFYLKSLYPPFVKLLNGIDEYTTHKEEDTQSYWLFFVGLVMFAFVGTILNLLIFPLVSGVIFTYLIITFKMKYGVETPKDDSVEN